MELESTIPLGESDRRLERLLEISRALSATRDLQGFLNSVIAAASELTGCETASILEMEESGQQFHFLATPWFHRDALDSVKVPVDNSVAGWVFENEQPAVVPDVREEPHHFKGADRAADFVTHSLLAVPITYQGDSLGVLEVVNKTGAANYTEDDLTILDTLSALAAAAIHNSRLAKKVRESDEETARLDNMKDDFIAIASHELRTPLGLILGHATYLQEFITDEYKAQMSIIVRNSLRLKDIIDNIAKMDNAQRGMASVRTNTTSIKQLIKEVLASFAKEAQSKQISLGSQLGAGDLLVEGEASKISIALSNVVKNSLDFTNPGGNVSIAAEQITGYVQVTVRDDGIGIPGKDLPHIFERFYQVESHLTRKHGGMGLGLSVAKVMTELHGGRIWAESVEGQGSTFTILLPVNPGPLKTSKSVIIH